MAIVASEYQDYDGHSCGGKWFRWTQQHNSRASARMIVVIMTLHSVRWTIRLHSLQEAQDLVRWWARNRRDGDYLCG